MKQYDLRYIVLQKQVHIFIYVGDIDGEQMIYSNSTNSLSAKEKDGIYVSAYETGDIKPSAQNDTEAVYEFTVEDGTVFYYYFRKPNKTGDTDINRFLQSRGRVITEKAFNWCLENIK